MHKKNLVTIDGFLEIILREWEGIDKKIYVNLCRKDWSR